VRRKILMGLSLMLMTAGPLSARTFESASLAPQIGADMLSRSVTREQLGRDLFANPYSTVTIGNVDVYKVFPYVETRTFQVVSDPQWNRLVFGEPGKNLSAYDGKGTSLGELSSPHGLAVDEQNRVYVADSRNNRIVVLQATTQFDEITLVPLFSIEGLSNPYGVAYSDGGTPFQPGDDFLYVADTGRNRIVAFSLGATSARQVAAIGDLGSGVGHFAGPLAITVGRSGGVNTPDVYVADAHTRRLIHLRNQNGSLQWIADQHQDSDVLTSLDTDRWGNLYAASPNRGVIEKYNSDLVLVDELHQGLVRPRSFNVAFFNVHDHVANAASRVGQPNAISLEQWTDNSGARMWNLGVAVQNLAVEGGDTPSAQFQLTDQANVALQVVDLSDGRILSSRGLGGMGAGVHTVALTSDDVKGGGTSPLVLRLSAVSAYENGPTDVAQATFAGPGGSSMSASGPMLFESAPNPFKPSTRISFVLPNSNSGNVSLRVFDAMGRTVRTFHPQFSPGLNEIVWDGTDDAGAGVSAGLYFYRLNVGDKQFTRKMVRVQ
jgi:NHL repeat/FlgD Ig-like domain